MEEKKSISILFDKNKNHITAPISGAWGGISPDGNSIVLNLFQEYLTMPSYQTAEIIEGQVDLNHPQNVSRGDVTREIMGTFVLPPRTAKVIGEWLIKQAENFENLPK